VDDHGEGTTLDNPVLYQREALPVDDALDGLAELVDSLYDRKPIENEYRDALSTVRSEVERLREERDEWENTARAESDGLMAHYNARQAAEAEVRQLREERDEAERLYDEAEISLTAMEKRAEAAEVENQRLTEGLREISRIAVNGDDHAIPDPLARLDAIESVARALLSANPPQGDAAEGSSPSDGPDDFCEHGYTTEDSAHPSAGLERCPTCSPSDGGGAK